MNKLLLVLIILIIICVLFLFLNQYSTSNLMWCILFLMFGVDVIKNKL